ncbi:MAG: TatD family hydrolase [Kiritimatiellae bacterium]|nr:TatD family hydrolase [Kiritimatiellia bacterium]
MTDAHCHAPGGAARHFICSPADGAACADDVVFIGAHPWFADGFDPARLRDRLAADPRLGVGEIGLDRLRERVISPRMREVFGQQLAIAAEFRRPVALHGAKCWGEVLKAASAVRGVPAWLFHGFSRSEGLLDGITAVNGFISVGPAVLNDHAVNYRALVKKIPSERLLVETDRTAENAAVTPPVEAIAAKLAELRGVPADILAGVLEANADRLVERLVRAPPFYGIIT